jgi:hypothetical protein
MRAEGFFCSLDVLYGGLGISKLQSLIKKDFLKFRLYFFLSFLVFKILDPGWIRIRILLKCWIRIRIHNSACRYTVSH